MVRRVLLAAGLVALLAIVVRSVPVPTPPPSSSVVGSMGRGPTVVLLHGLGSDANDWMTTARELARDHRVLLVELPGHGVTPMASPFTLEQASLLLERAIASEAREPVVLVGHSVGGLVAASMAMRAPQRVRGLVLVETALAPQSTPAEADTLRALLDRDWEGTMRDIYVSFGRDSLQGEALWAAASQLERHDLRRWIEVALRTDLSAQGADLPMPVLAVLSERSWEPGETWEHAAHALGYDRVPRLRGEAIAGCGHFVMLDEPAKLARSIRRFVARGDSLVATL